MNIEINVPNGKSGNWVVEDFEITEDGARLHNMRAMFQEGERSVRPGKYKRLLRSGLVIMSNTPAEISDHVEFMRLAKCGGDILINGLGLGVALKEILTSDKVNTVTVIEASEDVIKLVSDTYDTDNRVTIIHANAFEFKPQKGIRYNAVWHDIWDNICADNLPEMTKLHRKYGKRTDWQGSWCKDLCLRYR